MSEQDCGEDLVELGLLRARVRELEAANVALASESERMTRMVIGYERELCEAGTKLASALEQLRQGQQDAEEMGRTIAEDQKKYLLCVSDVIDDAIAEDRGIRQTKRPIGAP